MYGNTIKGKFYRRKSDPMSDYCIDLVYSEDYSNIPSKLKTGNGKIMLTVVGYNLPQLENCVVEYFGDWSENRKYGLQFKAQSYQIEKPSTEKGIIAFLSSKAFPGIGDKTASLMVQHFGKDVFEVIEKTPNHLLAVRGITPKKLGTIVNAYKKNQSYSEISVFLSTYGIGGEAIAKINDRYGANAIATIKENPYAIREIKGIGFKTCDIIAKGLGVALNSYQRIVGAIEEVIRHHNETTGDTCMEVEQFERQTLMLLNKDLPADTVSAEVFHKACSGARADGLIVFRLKKYVFLKAYDDAELQSSIVIKTMVNDTVNFNESDVDNAIDAYHKNYTSIKLSLKQKQAAKKALMSKLSIITGGPGTGKTTILKCIVEAYSKLSPDLDVTLLAPTGKAARRMSEATGLVASTIHSKLNIFDLDAGEPDKLPEGLIVVDETSMVDMLLLSKLLNAVWGSETQLLFIGDVDQLPSVGAGNCLADMIDSGVIPVTRLTEIFRQKDGGSIVENSIRVNNGNSELEYDKDFEFIEAENEQDALEEIKEVYKEQTKIYGIDNVSLLSPLRRTQQGRFTVVADSLNKELQNVANPTKALYCNLFNTEYRLGDRVLQWKNTEKSSNGDIGEIVNIAQNDDEIKVSIHWDNGNDTIENRESMADISLAYSISVHKSQGSEYDSVILPLLSVQKCQIFKRNLIYTAISRAKKHLIIIGDKKALDFGVAQTDTGRKTLFKQRLI